jgi:two-component sensor histidine kinase
MGTSTITISAEPINLPVSEAIPCGLILNELLSNSFKHAFPEGRIGSIQITFKAREDDRVELSGSDDGIGLPENFQIEDSKSMGMQVVGVLVNQLDANLEIRRDGGTLFILAWSK